MHLASSENEVTYMYDDLLKVENVGCWLSGQLRFVLEIEILINPSVSVELRTDIDECEAPTG